MQLATTCMHSLIHTITCGMRSTTHSNNTEWFSGHVIRGVDEEREHQNVHLVATKRGEQMWSKSEHTLLSGVIYHFLV